MIRDHRRGLLALLAGLTCLAVAPSAALAQSGTSDSGSIAQTQYAPLPPTVAPPLVPPSGGTVPGTSTPPAQGVLPGGDQSDMPSGDASEPSGDGGDDAGTGTPAGGGDDSEPGTPSRESGVNATAADTGALPFTGGLVLPIAAAGLLLLAAGAVLRRRTVG